MIQEWEGLSIFLLQNIRKYDRKKGTKGFQNGKGPKEWIGGGFVGLGGTVGRNSFHPVGHS